jgi:uncharacterized repeat protein (TIGR03803 family)
MRRVVGLGAIDPLTKVIFNIYKFEPSSDDTLPYGGLYQDGSGVLYGTTVSGGSYGAGAVYSVDPASSNTETIIYPFGGPPDGFHPFSTLIADANGVLYGTTQEGGTSTACGKNKDGKNIGCGIIFALTPNPSTGKYVETILYNFQNSPDGAKPYAGVVEANGVLYGTTQVGGADKQGTVFSLNPSNPSTYKQLYSFTGGADGGLPNAIAEYNGTLYGTTAAGGLGVGSVFSMTLSGAITPLYAFNPFATPSDGWAPEDQLILDPKSGLLYGTTANGGRFSFGTVFRISPTGTSYKVVYSFGGRRVGDGATPYAALTESPTNTEIFYGTTVAGGTGPCDAPNNGVEIGCGTVFELDLSGKSPVEKVLTSFKGDAHDSGAFPYAGVVAEPTEGQLYGVTYNGGTKNLTICPQGCGVLYEYDRHAAAKSDR